MGIVALLALGGCGFAGWVVGRLIKVAAEVMDVLADGAEAALRTNELIERHVVPALARIASALERNEPARTGTGTRSNPVIENDLDMTQKPNATPGGPAAMNRSTKSHRSSSRPRIRPKHRPAAGRGLHWRSWRFWRFWRSWPSE